VLALIGASVHTRERVTVVEIRYLTFVVVSHERVHERDELGACEMHVLDGRLGERRRFARIASVAVLDVIFVCNTLYG